MDTFMRLRLDVLVRAAESKIMEPLRRHGWQPRIERQVEAGEHLIMAAERGGHRRTFALLYTSATANETYRALAAEVGTIFVNGDLWNIASYASGVDTPIHSADDFQSVLVEWNRETSEGKFAPDADGDAAIDVEEESGDRRLLLSEAPIEAVWLRLRQLQSIRLAGKLIAERATREKVEIVQSSSTTKAEGVAFALRNAADYYSASQTRNVSQRVLNLYYGTMAFAFAEMLATPTGPSTLAEIEDSTKLGHGLYAIDGRTSDLQDIVVGVIRSGFFPQWMKVLGHDVSRLSPAKAKTFAATGALPIGSWLTLEELFARIPEISDLFQDIFDSRLFWLRPDYDVAANRSGSALGAQATRTYGILTDVSGRMSKEDVAAFPGPISEIRRLPSKGRECRFGFAVDHAGMEVWWDALETHTSPLGPTALIQPIFNGVSTYRAICFVLLYALSIVVRYRPSVWRRVQEGDLDHMRVLIEAFLAVAERVLPEQFLASVTASRIFAKQPGSFF